MNELCHHGVLGQRWGVRRYQDRNGALTGAGKKKKEQLEREYKELMSIGSITQRGKQRKSEVQKQYKELTGKSVNSETSSSKQSVHRKTIHDMTNEELQAYNSRKQLENTYLNFQPKEKISKGKQFMDVAVNKVVVPAAIDAGKAYMTDIFKKAMGMKEPTKQKIHVSKPAK